MTQRTRRSGEQFGAVSTVRDSFARVAGFRRALRSVTHGLRRGLNSCARFASFPEPLWLHRNKVLTSYLRLHLDILFVGLNPPTQSNDNGHYFSGSNSRFFHLLYRSGLVTADLPKSNADEIVFGLTRVNYKSCSYGVVDLVEDIIQTDSRKVRPKPEHVGSLLGKVCEYEPRFVCVIHCKVRKALNSRSYLTKPLGYGICGPLLRGSDSNFVLNYFPNGNNLADERKLEIFRALRDAL